VGHRRLPLEAILAPTTLHRFHVSVIPFQMTVATFVVAN